MKLPPGHVAGMGVHKATAYGGFGQKMLEKMGWNEGQGLGKEKHGMREAIEVKKKEDNLGVGANTTGWKWDWKYWEDAYITGLQSISKSEQKRKRRKLSSSSSSSNSSEADSRSDSDSSESDDEHNARIAEACGVVINRDGTAASASTAELKLAEELAKDCRGPAGRFGGRAGKMARIRQQEEEQAAAVRARLGVPHSASTGNLCNSSASEDTLACKRSSKKRKQLSASAASAAAGSSSDAEQASAVAVEQQQQQRKKTKMGRKGAVDTNQQQQQQPASEQEAAAAAAAADARKAPLVIVVDIKGAGPNVKAFESFNPTPATGWWGAKVFASAGLLESIEDEHKQRRRTTFDEDMQTRVYMAAHDAQRQGRKGLGKSTILKIAGGNWQGKKVAFDQEAVAGADNAAAEQPGNDQQQEQQAHPTAASSSPSSPAAIITKVVSDTTRTRQHKKQKDSNKPGKVRWAKLAVMQLQEVPGGVLKWSRLWKQLKQVAQMQQVEIAGSCKERALRKLQGCSQLQVTGKLVSLVA